MISEQILYWLAKRWPSPVKKKDMVLGEDPNSDEYLINYAQKIQYASKVRNGIGLEIENKQVLEIGCGHGGIATFFAVNGAMAVVGIDLNVNNLRIANLFRESVAQRLGTLELPVSFLEMDATQLAFQDGSFDLIIADNVFEHFMQPDLVMRECFRVLRTGGILSIASMPSIYSRHGLHLKNGIKMPWANLFFSERTICKVMVKLAQENPRIKDFYPGVLNKPTSVRELRAYHDLNGMTYTNLKNIAKQVGFRQKAFHITPSPRLLGPLVHKISLLRNSRVGDIFSNKASAIFEKV